MQISRSMTHKTKSNFFQFSSDFLASSSIRPSSSFFLAIILSLLEIVIKFKSNPDYTQTFTKSLQTLLQKVENYVQSNQLNQDILTNFNQILLLLQETSDPIRAFQYLSYFSETQELDSIITLEYTSRYIFAVLFSDDDKVEESVIIKDRGIRSCRKALEKICFELPIKLILIEGNYKNCYQNRMSRILANVFLAKEQKRFWVLYPSECWQIMRVFPDDSRSLMAWPHISVDDTNAVPLDLSSDRKLDLSKPDMREIGNQTDNLELQTESCGLGLVPIEKPLKKQESTYSITSINQSIISEGQYHEPPYSEPYHPSKYNYFQDIDPNLTEQNKFEKDLQEETETKTRIDSLMDPKVLNIEIFLRYLKAIEISFKLVGLSSILNEFCQIKKIVGFDKNMMIEFLSENLPRENYSYLHINELILNLKENKIVDHVNELTTFEAFVKSEVEIDQDFSHDGMGKVLAELIIGIELGFEKIDGK